MTQTEEKIENFTNSVGVDLSSQFEKQVSRTIQELMDSLENRLIDDETKVDYATHVFAKALDEMVDYLESPKLLNWQTVIFVVLFIFNLIVKDTKTGEEELNALWLEVEILTDIKYLNRKIPPKVSDQFSDEANKAIENLKDLNQRINLWVINAVLYTPIEISLLAFQ